MATVVQICRPKEHQNDRLRPLPPNPRPPAEPPASPGGLRKVKCSISYVNLPGAFRGFRTRYRRRLIALMNNDVIIGIGLNPLTYLVRQGYGAA